MANTATPFLDAVAKRRTVYTLGNTSPIDKSRIIEIVHHSLKYCPSPFNVRTCRIIILFGEDHTKLWEHTKEVVPEHIPAEFRDFLVARIDGALAAYGTILFFDDSTAYSNIPPHFAALLAERPDGEHRSQGMNEFIVWTALSAEGLGANIQHFQPGISSYVSKTFDVPESWTLKCQMIFGEPTAGPGDEPPRTYLEDALRVHGA